MKDIICKETAQLGLQLYRHRLRAVVLTGSLARNEGTFVQRAGGCQLHGDAELMFVFGDDAVLPPNADLAVMCQQIEERISRQGLRAEITVSAVRPSYFRRLEPSIFAYELKACGETVAGDETLLALIPDFGAGEIPREDAWRMLANRLVEQLESVDELLEGRPTLSPGSYYRTVKLYLDMATSLLVFAGAYAPTYGERCKALSLLVDPPPSVKSWPFPIETFASDVAACTEWKLSPTGPANTSRRFWEQAVDYAQALWQWELTLLQGRDAAAVPSTDLWMRRQPMRQRLRGWAHVTRQEGWLASWPCWPQWARQAFVASPRYSVYAAATELVFHLRSVNGLDGEAQSVELRRRLPVVTGNGSRNGTSACSQLAADVLLNYRKFLVNTRA